MTTALRTLSLAALGAAALTTTSIAPAQAFQLNTFNFSGHLGTQQDCGPNIYWEYENARFEGTYSVLDNAPNLNAGEEEWEGYGEGEGEEHKPGKYSLFNFVMTIYLANGYTSTVTLQPTTEAFVEIASTRVTVGNTTSPDTSTAADNSNHSTFNPTRLNLTMFFANFSGDPNHAPTQAPEWVDGSQGFDPSQSFIQLFDPNKSNSLRTIGITDARIEAVPEPTTMVGMGVFGLGVLLKKRMKKN